MIELLVYFYFSAATLYVLFFSVAAMLSRPVGPLPGNGPEKYHRIAVLVPAYKEDSIIVPVAKSLVGLDYPAGLFEIVIIADSLQRATLDALKAMPVKVIEVNFQKSTKARSLNYAIGQLGEGHDLVVVSDADNVMESGFLLRVNQAYNQGFKAVQGRRFAKNLNTPFAVLDGASEIINNHIFRKGFNAAGLSSALIGSGMAFDFKVLKQALAKIDAVGGFDKELQLSLIADRHKILYLEDAVVFDEKIEQSAAFENQRRRWVSSQYIYFRKFFQNGIKHLFQGNFDYFNIAILYNLFPSRILTLGFIGVCAISVSLAGTFIPSALYIGVWYWWALLGVYALALLMAIPLRFYDRKSVGALLNLPYAFLIMLLSMFKLKGANRQFIHTVHKVTEVDDHILAKK